MKLGDPETTILFQVCRAHDTAFVMFNPFDVSDDGDSDGGDDCDGDDCDDYDDGDDGDCDDGDDCDGDVAWR